MGMKNKMTVADVDIKGKRVIARVDFNVPLDENGNITDDKRIRAALPTIRHIIGQGACLILVSHLGRPKEGPDPKYSMKPAAERLSELLGKEVKLAADVIGEDAKAKAAALKEGEVLMLENVRFHKEETKNDPAFAKELASMADIYVNDAFGTAHRAHASTAGIAEYLPAVSGFLIKKELDVMGKALDDPERPFVAILGGAKVSDKIGVIESLLDKVDTLIIGGSMAYTFFAGKGYSVGTSKYEADKVDLASNLLAKAEKKGVRLLLPVDNVVGKEFDPDTESQVVDSDNIPEGWMGLDIGLRPWNSSRKLLRARRPLCGTVRLASLSLRGCGWHQEYSGALSAASAVTIVGGATVAAIEQMGFSDKITHFHGRRRLP